MRRSTFSLAHSASVRCIILLVHFSFTILLSNLFPSESYSQTNSPNSCTIKIKVIPEGFHDIVANRLNMRDTVKAYLINMYQPSIVDSAKAVIDSITFEGNFIFSNAPTGKYYIVITHRNSIKTWSRAQGEIITAGVPSSFDFTNDSSKAYGNNLKKNGNIWCIFSGDINQDGIINLTDLSVTSDDALNYLAGYLVTDLTGDGFVELADLVLVDNNNFKSVGEMKPSLPGGTCPGIPTVEYAGKTYNTVQIGTLCWLKENLNIGIKINTPDYFSDNGIIEKYCYNNDTNNCNIYGGLYSWYEAAQYTYDSMITRGICPEGWHMPDMFEFNNLQVAVDSNGNSLKAIGQGNGAGAGTNSSGFSGLLGGAYQSNYPDPGGEFINLSYGGQWWTQWPYPTSAPEDEEVDLNGNNNSIYIGSQYQYKFNAYNVRCVKNYTYYPPTLIQPLNGDVNVPVSILFKWNSVSGATEYHLQISTDTQFTYGTIIYDVRILYDTIKLITGLNNNTQYFWRVSAWNYFWWSEWSEIWSFTTTTTCPVTVGHAGKTYNTIQIGDQCWLKENLNIGTRINGSQNQNNNSTIEKYCYNDSANNCNIYGGLYQWNEAMQYSSVEGSKGICPIGWHIPTDDEWCTLTQFIDNTVDCGTTGWSGTDAGYKMKSTAGWNSGGNGNDQFGFKALASGFHQASDFYFNQLGTNTYYFSSSSTTIDNAWDRRLAGSNSIVGRQPAIKNDGFSVRCIKD
jgi:uncharacterized protein (TIGR02145 family)